MKERDRAAGHAFISYGRADSHQVDLLQRALQASGVPVWRDTADLLPGEDWHMKIRNAITDNALVFIACFSRSSLSCDISYQNEELTLAIDQLRLRRPDEPWLIPVRLDECDIPDLNIGGGRTLASIQCADVFGDRFEEGAERLVAAVLRILGRQFTSTTNAAARISADVHNVTQPGGDGSTKEATKDTGPVRADPTRTAHIVTDAGRATQSITYESSKAAALAVIAASLAAIDPARLLSYGRDRRARSLTRNHPKISLLAQVAATLAAIDPSSADRLLADAERIAQSITDKKSKAQALADVAGTLAATDPDRAEHIAQSITDGQPKTWALADVAGALAATDADHARRLFIDSYRAAQSIPDKYLKAKTLADVAWELATIDPDRAKHIADSISENSVKHFVLVEIETMLAATDPDRSERFAQSVGGHKRVTVLTNAALALTGTDPDRAARLLDRAERLARSNKSVGYNEYAKAWALADVAVGRAATDPDHAEHLAQSITVEHLKAWALADVAGAVAATDPDRAEQIAQSISDDCSKAWALADIAAALTATDTNHAARLFTDAARATEWIIHDGSRASALAHIGKAWNDSQDRRA